MFLWLSFFFSLSLVFYFSLFFRSPTSPGFPQYMCICSDLPWLILFSSSACLPPFFSSSFPLLPCLFYSDSPPPFLCLKSCYDSFIFFLDRFFFFSLSTILFRIFTFASFSSCFFFTFFSFFFSYLPALLLACPFSPCSCDYFFLPLSIPVPHVYSSPVLLFFFFFFSPYTSSSISPFLLLPGVFFFFFLSYSTFSLATPLASVPIYPFPLFSSLSSRSLFLLFFVLFQLIIALLHALLFLPLSFVTHFPGLSRSLLLFRLKFSREELEKSFLNENP